MLTANVSKETITSSPKTEKLSGPSRFEVFLLFLPLIRITVFLRRNAEAYATIDPFAIFDIIAMFFVGFYLLCVLYRFPWHKLFGSCMGWVFLYYVFCISSFLWRMEGSSAPYIIYRATSMTVMILYVFYLMSRFQTAQAALEGVLKYVLLILLLGMIGAIKNGGFSLAMLHTNSYSFAAAVLAALALTSVKCRERTFSQVKWYLFFGLAGVLLGTSTGSNIAFAMALCFVFCVGKEKVDPLLVMLLPVIGILIYEFFLPELVRLLAPGKSMAGIMSGTGRVKMWNIYLEAWQQRPWLGYGFCIGERAGQFFRYTYTLSAHNGYISVLVNTGLIGAFFFGMFILSWMFSLLRQMSLNNKHVFPVIAAFIVIMVNNMSVPTIGSQWGVLSTVVLLVGSYFALFCQAEPKSRFARPETEK